MRNIMTVLEVIDLLIPNALEDFHRDIGWIKRGAPYKAPEIIGQCWLQLTQTLEKHLPGPLTEEWQIKVISVFSDETFEATKARYGEK